MASVKKTIIDFQDIASNYNFAANTTSPFLSKYERIKIIGLRAEQLQRGSEAYIVWDTSQTFDARKIATEEMAQNKLPFMLARTLPDNSKEYFKLSDMKNICHQ